MILWKDFVLDDFLGPILMDEGVEKNEAQVDHSNIMEDGKGVIQETRPTQQPSLFSQEEREVTRSYAHSKNATVQEGRSITDGSERLDSTPPGREADRERPPALHTLSKETHE